MARFCTKCGSPIPEGMQFCTGCGATVGPPPVARAPVAPAPAAPAPGPTVAKPSSGSPIVKIILIVLAVVILFGVLIAGGCVWFLYRTKQKLNQFQKQVTTTFPVPTGTGAARAQPGGAPIDTGVAVYPGATPQGQGTTVNIGPATIKTQSYTTSDSAAQVTAFYKDKLGANAMVTQAGEQAILQLSGSNGYVQVVVAPEAGSGKTKVTIEILTK